MTATGRMIVCGSRRWNDQGLLGAVLDHLRHDGAPITTLIHGGARGADQMAGRWAERVGDSITVEVFPARWEEHGNAAGPIRNQAMLAAGADLVVAFKRGAASPGTDHMVRIARDAGVPTILVQVTE